MEENQGHTFFKFIIDYWSQIAVIITILVGGIGYLLKIGFDWDLKKREIKYSMILTKRTTALENFISNTNGYQTFFNNLPYYNVGRQEIEPIKIDEMVDKYKTPFYRSYGAFNIFAEVKDKSTIKEVYNLLLDNNKHLNKLLFSNLSQNEGYHPDDYFGSIVENGKKIDVLIEKLIISTGYGKL
ncbi:hypothetical protein ACL9RF_04385 [Sphingobacterium sp. Mn56C]|uniref:hypothetical protein n=1 Tax=Sphingobacterium sp. Mn56C TaxID=3395261 RepID=UPI003BC4E9DB